MGSKNICAKVGTFGIFFGAVNASWRGPMARKSLGDVAIGRILMGLAIPHTQCFDHGTYGGLCEMNEV